MSFIREVRSDIEREAVRLLREYRSSLFREAVRLCGDVHTAEDLVMRTIETFFAKREDELPPDDKTYSWLRTTLQNLYWNMVRTKAYARTVYVNTADAAKLDEIAPVDNSTDEAIVAHDEAELVRRAIASLPKDTRNVIMLRYFESLSIGEIAKLTCRSVDSIKCNLYYARKVLAKRLAKALGRTSAAVIALLLAVLGYAAVTFTGVFTPSEPPDAVAAEQTAAETAADGPLAAAETQTAEPVSASDAGSPASTSTNEQEKTVVEQQIIEKEQSMNTNTCTKVLAATSLAASLAASPMALASSTDSYIKNGLVAHWDGVENAGRGVHDPSATVWKDLVEGREFTLYNVTVEDNGMVFAGAQTSYGELSAADTAATFENASDGTLEIVYASRSTSESQIILQSSEASGHAASIWQSSRFLAACGSANNSPYFNFTSGKATNIVSVLYTSAKPGTARVNGNRLTSAGLDCWVGATDVTTIGTRTSKSNNPFNGAIYSIRVYNRRLTDEEIDANHAIDRKRFIEGDTSVFDCELIDVSTNAAKVVWEADTPAPSQLTARFVSGFAPDLSDGVALQLGSFASGTVVTSAVAFARASSTYWRIEAEDEGGNVFRSLISAIPVFVGDGARDYVSSGLVAQWDGIENIGDGLHSANPQVWKDLVGSGDVAIPAWVTASSNSLVSVGSTDSSRGYPTLPSIDGLDGDDVTIEAVARRVRWTVGDNYDNLQPAIGSPWGWFGYRHLNDEGFYYMLPPNGSTVNQARLRPATAGGLKVTERQTMAVRVTRNSADAVNDFTVSGVKATPSLDDYAAGLPSEWTFFRHLRTEVEFFAIRVYNRRLTDEELATNAAIDERRFGAGPEVPPLRESFDGPGASYRSGNDYWPVSGERFSRSVAHAVENGGSVSICVGWTLFAETGDDVWEEESHGTTCEVSYLEDGRRRRLVWHTALSQNLPGGYVRLESIDANGQQLIDTGYSPNYMTHATLDLQFDGTYILNATSAFFGASDSGDPDHLIFSCNFGSGSGRDLYFWTQKSYAGGASTMNMVVPEDVVKARNTLDIDMEAGIANYDGNTRSVSKRTASQTQPETVKLFGRDNPFNAYPTMRLFGATFADGSTLRRDFVPAQSLDTGRRGLYDLVDGNFYTNIVENGADFGGTVCGLHVDGEPERLGEPTIPYGCNLVDAGAAFELVEPNVVQAAGERMVVKSIARYSFNATTGQWELSGRTPGSKVAATYTGEPVKYVLEWRPGGTGFFFIVH